MKTSSIFLVGSLSAIVTSSALADVQFEKAGFSIGTVHDEHVKFFDRENDGFLDAITYNQYNSSLFSGRENGYIVESQGAITGLVSGNDGNYISTADMNGDGFEDIISYPFKISLNDRQGQFLTPTYSHPRLLSGEYTQIQPVDLDQNGLIDLLVSNSYRSNGLYQGVTYAFMNITYDANQSRQGYFSYEREVQYSPSESPLSGKITNMKPNGVAIGDLNNDGMPDVIFINSAKGTSANSNSVVTLNNGSGDLVFGQLLSNAEDITLGDLDNDGDQDAYLTRAQGQPDEVWLNNGLGVFTNTSQSLGTGDGLLSAMADLDGDGDLDVVTANQNQMYMVWLNDGTGQLILSNFHFGMGQNAKSLELIDIDKDGDKDIVTLGGRKYYNIPAGYQGSIFLSSNEIWLNQLATNSDAASGIELCQNNPNDYGLFSQSQFDQALNDALIEGINLCQENPKDFGLFAQTDVDDALLAGMNQGKTAGTQSCKDDPESCGLFDQADLDSSFSSGFTKGQQACKDTPSNCGLFDQQYVDTAVDQNIDQAVKEIISQLPKGQIQSVCRKYPHSLLCLGTAGH